MRFTTAIVLASAGIAAAQSSSAAAPAASGSPSGCGSAIDAIIKACLASTTPQLDKCAVQDWHCLCTQASNVLTCYDNCPSDPDAFGAKSKMTSYCNAAKTVPSSTAADSKGSKATPTISSSAAAGNGAHTGFATASGSAAASTDNAAPGLAPAGGLLAAMFGLALL